MEFVQGVGFVTVAERFIHGRGVEPVAEAGAGPCGATPVAEPGAGPPSVSGCARATSPPLRGVADRRAGIRASGSVRSSGGRR
jgi:hypothetical protein